MSGGYIKLHRKWLKSWISHLPPLRQYILIRLLLETRWDRHELKNGLVLERGQYLISYRNFAERCETSVSTIARTLREAAREGFLTRTVTRRGTIVTITNWDTYQGGPTTQDTQSGTRAGTRAGTQEKKGREKKGIKNPPTPRKRGDDALPIAERFNELWALYPHYERRSRKGESLKRFKTYRLYRDMVWSELLLDVRANTHSNPDWDRGAVPGLQVYLKRFADELKAGAITGPPTDPAGHRASNMGHSASQTAEQWIFRNARRVADLVRENAPLHSATVAATRAMRAHVQVGKPWEGVDPCEDSMILQEAANELEKMVSNRRGSL